MADQFSRMYDVERVGGDQRTRLAEMLRAAGQNQPQGQMVSGWYVPPSWSQNLNTALSGALGTYIGAKLDEERKQKTAEILRQLSEGAPVEQQQPVQNINRIESMAEGQTQQEPQNQLQRIMQGAKPQQGEMTPLVSKQPEQPKFRPLTEEEKIGKVMELAQYNPYAAQIWSTQDTARQNRLSEAEKRQADREFKEQQMLRDQQFRREMAQYAIGNRPEPLVAVMGKDGNAQLIPRSQAVGMTPFNAAGAGAGSPAARQREATEAVDIVLQAAPLVRQATSSGIGAAVDWAGGLIGKSATSADKAADLKVLGGMLVSKMPKMSGPQSDKDVLLYKEMAGRIGDPTVPASQKESALQTIYNLNAKYAGLPERTLSFEPNSVMPGVGTSSNW